MNKIARDKKLFFFFGDDIVDIHQVEKQDSGTRSKPQFNQYKIDGGILLLAKMINSALYHEKRSKKIPRNIRDNPKISAINYLKNYEPKLNTPPLFRIKHFMGFHLPEKNQEPHELDFFMDSGGYHKTITKGTQECDLIVINDEGIISEKDNANYSSVLDKIGNSSIVIYKMDPSNYKKRLWNNIISDKNFGNLITIVNVERLRDIGADISICSSWQRMFDDFHRDLLYNSKISFLKESSYIIVKIRDEGAILCCPEKKWTKLFFDPFLLEGDFGEQFEGTMPSSTNAFIAGFIQGMLTHISSQKGGQRKKTATLGVLADERFETGIKYGILSSRELLHLGFFVRRNGAIDYPVNKIFKDICSDQENQQYDLKLLETSDFENSMIKSVKNSQSIVELAYSITRQGIEKVPGINFPICKYRDLICTDRNEIESYQIIKNLIKQYINNPNFLKPLSIAVFGPPGSGKSFGIDEVVGSIHREKVKRLIFNLSQFDSYTDLVHSFHKVRDSALEGKLPLVFYDEFDCKLDDQEYGWIKYFLQPMQDGCFRSDRSDHPLGRSIFIFAGGINRSFEDFKKISEDEDKSDSKLKDFISRLEGYINIIGINNEDTDSEDKMNMIQRAIVLRSIIKKSAPDLFDKKSDELRIDQGVLRGFIKTPKFIYGVRSLKAIVEMSLLKEQTSFEPSALPPIKQLSLHVDTKEFLNLVHRDEIFNQKSENIAKRIYEDKDNFRKFFLSGNKTIMNNNEEWETLKTDDKNVIRKIVKGFPKYLSDRKYTYRTSSQTTDGEGPQLEVKDEQIEKIIELLKSERFQVLPFA